MASSGGDEKSIFELIDRLPVTVARSVPPTPPRIVNKIAGASVRIAVQDAPQMEFLHSTFAHVGLPRQAVKDGGSYRRECGNSSILVTPGSLWNGSDWELHPVPFGTKPRLILAYLCSYATRHQTRDVPVGSSMMEFMRILGHRTISGGKTGNMTMFRNQVLSLSAADIRIGYRSAQGAVTSKNLVVDGFAFWSEDGNPGRDQWPGVLQLSEGFFESLREHAFPVDATALRALDSSALAMDLYVWLAHRLCRIGARPLLLHWSSLFQQFGEGTQSLPDFKWYFRKMLTRVLAVYPDAKVELPHTGGLLLKQSSAPVPSKVQVFMPKVKAG